MGGSDLDVISVQAARPVTCGHEAAHCLTALALAVPVLRVDARPPDPHTYLAWPPYQPRVWGPVLIAGYVWEDMTGWPHAGRAARDDLDQVVALMPWCSLPEARATALELLTVHAAKHAHLAAVLGRAGQLSGPEVAAWWYGRRELPSRSATDSPGAPGDHDSAPTASSRV